ncbi:transcription initiation factor TFIID subunit 2 isoform X1 [Histomonas meleagridis]|uniref:transcription initiation factor TFIID subunit 2 isoform X1 n=1 Tax=Histomonas meleagridis TaxID=135588 RepID=UPI00355A165B|nr:transcription initiation factor TFIID subunit 2 isoform X1 [Histomonas meleagridis]KAH0796571.1 transcription initiation factor TFIID subunit 2 isoform X1 [Histomonas meleagridis]
MSLGTSPLRVVKQHVVINVQDDPLLITGSTDIEMSTYSIPPEIIFLHARQIDIKSVSANGKPVEYEYFDSHSAFLFKGHQLVRDAAHFSSVAKIVNESPDLYIHYSGQFPVTLHIEFQVRSDSTSIIQYNSIIYTDNRADGPSGWFPCIDSLAQRSLFTLAVTYNQSYICIGPGESSLISVDQQQRVNTMLFKIPFPVTASGLGFVIGPFVSQNIAPDIFSYFTGVSDEAFQNTLKPVPKLLASFNEKFGFEENYYSTISFVSIPCLTEVIVLPGLILVPPDLNSPIGNVNVFYINVPRLAEAIVGLFIYYLFPVSEQRDLWLPIGISAFFADVFSAKFFSESFRLDRRWNDINYLMVEDIFPSIVLSAIDPATGEPFKDPFLRVKAKLLVNMFARSMRNFDLQIVLLMKPLMKFCYEQPGFVTERFFSDLNRFCPNINFKTFRQQWLSSNGFPIFTYNFTNDARHNSMKLVLAQTPSAKTNVPFFTGQMLVHLRDLDQPYEFQFPVENQIQLQQFSYFAHRRKTKKKKFVYVNGEEKTVIVHHAVMWLIIDAQLSWICRVRPRLPQFMLLYQIELLHSVYAQHEAISSLEDFKDTEEALKTLESLLNNAQVFYAIRGHAARALAKFNQEQTDFKHMQILMDWYQNEFFQKTQQGFTVKPHDFKDVKRHFVQLEVLKSLSIIRDGKGYTPEKIVKWLIQIMESSNNNSNNMYNDDYFNAVVILALGRIKPETDDYYQKISSLILSKLTLHASIPSYCNIITNAGYKALTAISLKTTIFEPNTLEMRSVVIKDTNYYECRASVFNDLLYLALFDKNVTYEELISDLRSLALKGFYDITSLCLRQLYRFVLNHVKVTDEDKFETYLLSIPENISKEDMIRKIILGNNALEIAETLWEILSVHGKNHKMLRSEALRVYTTLYGDKLPSAYLNYKNGICPIELTSERSFGLVINIDTPHPMRSFSNAQLQQQLNQKNNMKQQKNSLNTSISMDLRNINKNENETINEIEIVNENGKDNEKEFDNLVMEKENIVEEVPKKKIRLKFVHRNYEIDEKNDEKSSVEVPKKIKLKMSQSVKQPKLKIKLTKPKNIKSDNESE